MKPHLVIPGIAALASTLGCQQQVDSNQDKNNKMGALPFRPNILWITCEDITPALGCYGDSLAKTPNLDKLASEGIRYTHAYSVAGVSAPSRCALITGMYSTSIGGHNMRTLSDKYEKSLGFKGYSIVPPPDVKCFSEHLRMNGYFCSNNDKTDYQFIPPVSAWDENSREAHWKHRKKGQPFFSVFNLVITHESRIWNNNWFRYHVLPEDVVLPPYYPDHQTVREDVARKYSNIALMDAQVGMYLDELEKAGLLDSTIIFFFSDHGGPLPREKRELYETGLRVPFIIRFPKKMYAGKVESRLVSFVDFAATVLSLAGIQPPAYMQGQAFLGAYEAEPRKYIFGARDRMDTEYDMVRAVRDSKYKYIRNYKPELPFVQNIRYRKSIPMMNVLYRYDSLGLFEGVQKLWWRKTKPLEELYDCEADPWEFNNLASNPDYTDKLKELREALENWQKQYGDKGFMDEKQMIKEMWGGASEVPKTEKPLIENNKGSISIVCPTPGASIAYKFSSRQKHWQVYTGPFTMNDHDSLWVVTHRIGYEPSENVINANALK